MNFPRAIATGLLTVATVFSASVSAQDVTKEERYRRAIQNSVHVLDYLSALFYTMVPVGIDNIEQGYFRRLEPNFPIWVLDSESGKILYYEGQPTFKYQPAEKLVDEAGQRFGLKAWDNAKRSRSKWQRVTLGGVSHDMYCAQKQPLAVCSLIPLTVHEFSKDEIVRANKTLER